MHSPLPPEHAVVPGLAGRETDGSPGQLGRIVGELLEAVPEGGRGFAVSHTPILEKATEALTGHRVEPLGECEGVVLTLDDDGPIDVQEIRLGAR
jgi:hypothetical protein